MLGALLTPVIKYLTRRTEGGTFSSAHTLWAESAHHGGNGMVAGTQGIACIVSEAGTWRRMNADVQLSFSFSLCPRFPTHRMVSPTLRV